MKDITIIIPHRNIPLLLNRCIESIPLTSNMEIIIIDDNSNKEKVDFNIFPGCNRTDTVVIYTKEGKGAGYARNVGLEHATGKWILFADADDFFLPNAFHIISDYLNTEYDIVFFNTIARMSDNLGIVSHRMDNYIKNINERDYNFSRYNSNTSVLKLFRHQFITDNDLRFEEIPLSNDMYFSCMAGIKAKQIKIDERNLMCITERSDSLIFHNHSKEERIIRFEAYIRCNVLLASIGKKRYRQEGLKFYLGNCKSFSDTLDIKYLFKFFRYTGFKSIVYVYWALKGIIKDVRHTSYLKQKDIN